MRSLPLILTLTLAATCAASAAVSLDANNMAAKEAFDSIGKQCGAQILVDADVTGNVTAVVKDMTADQAVDIVSKALGATYKKVQFASAPTTNVAADKLKAAISALAALDVPGISMADPTSGKVSVFAKGLGQDAVSGVKLPEGQSWRTYYLISKPAAKPASTTTTGSAAPSKDVSQRADKLASMPTDERQRYIQGEFVSEMQLAPDVRVQLWRERVTALRSMMDDPTTAETIRNDLRQAFRDLGWRGGRGGRDRGQAP